MKKNNIIIIRKIIVKMLGTFLCNLLLELKLNKSAYDLKLSQFESIR
jgi:hypothetical protein